MSGMVSPVRAPLPALMTAALVLAGAPLARAAGPVPSPPGRGAPGTRAGHRGAPRTGVANPPPPLSPAVASPLLATPAVGSCWLDVRPFESLAYGVFDYCRGHLRYAPGTFDCYRYLDQVCTLFDPTIGDWVQTRSVDLRSVVPCPEGPEPPVCRRFDL